MDVMSVRPVIGLGDVFAERARAFRRLQTALLNAFADAHYDEVIPRLLERPDVLRSGAGQFLADQTLVFNDPAGAGPLAIRPDITPQLARIAANHLLHDSVLRLSYSGPVVLARPDPLSDSRQQWQTGIELMGLPAADGDAEVIRLAAKALSIGGFHDPVLQLGHIALFKSLIQQSSASLETWTHLMMRRSPEDMQAHLQTDQAVDQDKAQALMDMVSGLADASWLLQHQDAFGDVFAVHAKHLLDLLEELSPQLNDVRLDLDLALMPRYLYHSGIVFSGYAPGVMHALLLGGRYDAMMKAHGRDMPATGFSLDLLAWIDAGSEA